jgi:hypothetical protein
MKGVAAAPLGAWEVALKIVQWIGLGSVAVITPVTAARSSFVRQVVERVNSGPIGKERQIGPFKLFWEAGHDEQIVRICDEVQLPNEDDAVVGYQTLALTGGGGIVRDWLSRQRRLFGRREFKAGEIREAVRQLVQRSRGHAHREERRLTAMSIHQAKNREFDRVLVLWPYEVSGSDERKRRLAYNAITRARHEVHIVVQNPARVSQSPFVPGANPAPNTRRDRTSTTSKDSVKSEKPGAKSKRTRPGVSR